MKYKVIVNRSFRIEREIEVNTHEEAIKLGEELQAAELPEDAVRSDELGVHEIT
ncbi:hypothetical protein [Acinetobacter sp. WCHAc060007]|uniref:hypothetical protein n=1 Tax=Acinetobacter sp. WCHAc060007 TaxID=2419605 RepID=UPI00148CF640|nr:hypothetical protein [Acinetobacter sp. WCHAc060007]